MFLGISSIYWIYIGLLVLLCLGLSYCLFGRRKDEPIDKGPIPINQKSTLEEATGIESEY